MQKSLTPDSSGRFTDTSPVAGITPVDGWELRSIDCEDGNGFSYKEFIARGPDSDVMLDLSRFRWTPSQDRFAWLVRKGFPARPKFGPWDDFDIEAGLAVERQLAECLAAEREQALAAINDNLTAVHAHIQALAAGDRL